MILGKRHVFKDISLKKFDYSRYGVNIIPCLQFCDISPRHFKMSLRYISCLSLRAFWRNFKIRHYQLSILPSSEFCQGEYGSVCFQLHPSSLHLLAKSPSTYYFETSNIIWGGTSYIWNIKDKDSWASLLLFIGNTRVHPKLVANNYACLCPCFEVVPAINVYPNPFCGNLRYQKSWLFVLNIWDKKVCKIVLIPNWLVTCNGFFAIYGYILYFFFRVR